MNWPDIVGISVMAVFWGFVFWVIATKAPRDAPRVPQRRSVDIPAQWQIKYRDEPARELRDGEEARDATN